MKKAKAALPVSIIVLLFVVVRPLCMATPDTTVFVDPKESNVKVGQTFAINISIVNVSGLIAFDFLLSYNTTVLQLTDIEEGPFLKSAGDTFLINLTTSGQVWLAACLYQPQGWTGISANGTGVLATATFKAIAAGESLLDLFSKDPYKPDEVKLAADPQDPPVVAIPNVAISGHVAVSSDPSSDPDPMPGGTTNPWDVVPDGKCDGKDIAVAAKCFGSVPGDSLWNPNCDVNDDGKVDGKDIALVARNFGMRAP